MGKVGILWHWHTDLSIDIKNKDDAFLWGIGAFPSGSMMCL